MGSQEAIMLPAGGKGTAVRTITVAEQMQHGKSGEKGLETNLRIAIGIIKKSSGEKAELLLAIERLRNVIEKQKKMIEALKEERKGSDDRLNKILDAKELFGDGFFGPFNDIFGKGKENK